MTFPRHYSKGVHTVATFGGLVWKVTHAFRAWALVGTPPRDLHSAVMRLLAEAKLPSSGTEMVMQ